MELTADLSKKNQLLTNVINATKELRRLSIISKRSFWIGLIIAMLYAVIWIAVPSLAITEIRGVPTKNMGGIISTAILIFLLGFFFKLISKYLLSNRAGIDLTERTEERLMIINGALRYTFRVRYQNLKNSMNVIIIPFKDITNAEYDEHLGKIEMEGRFSCDCIENYDSVEISEPSAGNLDRFVIFDYFEPGLVDTLRKNGVSVILK